MNGTPDVLEAQRPPDEHPAGVLRLVRVRRRRDGLGWVALVGAAGAFVAFTMVSITFSMWNNWRHGGSADPRCIYGIAGYVETYRRDFDKVTHVTCRYVSESQWRHPS